MLEQIYPVNLLERSTAYAFLLGLGYSIIGIGLAVLLFPEDPALVAVSLTALMFYPTISKLMKQEEGIESDKKEFSLFVFLRDHKSVFMVYLFMFVGIFLSFAYFTLLLPSLATNHIFKNQINVLYRSIGAAAFQKSLFFDILLNNLMVMLVIFITAFVIGDGGIFLITWNASVWGTIFGNMAKTAAITTNQNAFIYFAMIFIIVAPHMLLEAFSYIASATTAGVVSKAIIKEKILSNRFNYIIINTLISLVFAVAILLLAVTVETYVIGNVTIYKRIISQSISAIH